MKTNLYHPHLSVVPSSVRSGKPPLPSRSQRLQMHHAAVHAAGNTKPSLLSVISHLAPVLTLLGQVQDWKLEILGRISCTLVTSFGSIRLNGNRDKLLDLVDGDWIVAKILLKRHDASNCTSIFDVKRVTMQPSDPTTAWVPIADCHRVVHLRVLRQLLSRISPTLQVIFYLALADQSVQKAFFMRVAALDHHIYPGGLLDRGIAAAMHILVNEKLTLRDRALAAMACLLFDLGKVTEQNITADAGRGRLGLQPHPQTLKLLQKALLQIGHPQPEMVCALRALLAPGSWTEWIAPPGVEQSLKQHVHQAIQASWKCRAPK
jgi:hypothetical protein